MMDKEIGVHAPHGTPYRCWQVKMWGAAVTRFVSDAYTHAHSLPTFPQRCGFGQSVNKRRRMIKASRLALSG